MDPSFWKQEHDDHHASTNTYNGETGLIFDKQGKYHYWCQAEELLKAFPAQFMIKFQQYAALPLQLFLGKTGLLIQNWVEPTDFKRRWYHLVGVVMHWSWVIYLVRKQNFSVAFFFVFMTYQGLLSIIVLANHMHTPFDEMDEMKYRNFAERQTETTINYKTSRWFDWFFGGLHFHIEHHTFSKMPRNMIRQISYDVKEYNKDMGLFYDYRYFHEVLLLEQQHLLKIRDIHENNQKKQD